MAKSDKELYAYAATLLQYCPISGVFRWRWRDGDAMGNKIFNHWHAGKIAQDRDIKGYLRACMNWRGKKRYVKLHRLAWYISHGELPEQEIDHVNGQCADNRIDNLRSVTPLQNNKNRALHRNNKSGSAGVRWHQGSAKWRAEVQINRRKRHLGYYLSRDEATEVAQLAREMLGFSARHGAVAHAAQRAKGDGDA